MKVTRAVFGSLAVFIGSTLGLAVTVVSCSGGIAPPPAPANAWMPAGRATAALPLQVHVAHTNEALRVPSFVFLGTSNGQALAAGPGATALDAAWGTLRAVAPHFKLDEAALATAEVSQLHDVGRGAIITRFKQRVAGVEVFRATMNVALQRDLTPLAVTGSLAPMLKSLAPAGWVLDGHAASAAAIQAMTGATVAPDALADNGSDDAGYQLLGASASDGAGGILLVRTRAKQVWFPEDAGLQPAWYVEVDAANDQTNDAGLHALVIHAATGATLDDTDLVAADKYTYRVWADSTGPRGTAPLDSPYGNGLTPYAPGTLIPTARPPLYLPPTAITLQSIPFSKGDPWLPPNAAELSGNNVRAFADLSPPDGFQANSADLLIPPTKPGAFDRVWDPNTIPGLGPNGVSVNNVGAVTTNLFFVVNYMHDLFYDSGYDEVSGNSQLDNYGRGGVGKDPINAEAQDFSGINNANMATPADGASPRVRMYLWNTIAKRHVAVHTPAAIATTINSAATSGFGPLFWDFSGDVVLYLDATGGKSEACNATGGPANAAALAGKIALLDRGTCAFNEKALNARKAGAVALLMVNTPGVALPASFGSVDPNLANLPGMLIGSDDGQHIKDQLAAGAGVNVGFFREPPTRDGSVDGTIISHEWGHSLSHRLIANSSGLGTNQSNGMGEGWSDFVALLTYVRPTDLSVASNANWSGVYPLAAYALGATPSSLYFGIRRYPYSWDMTKNPLTFKHVQNGVPLPTNPAPASGADGSNNAEVHNTGEVWAQMLWDCYVGLLRDTAHYTFDKASQTMRDYLVASLKLTPPNPTITEARDAWLVAALANNANDFQTFAQAFARRGAGTGAISPPRNSNTNIGVVESFVVGNDVALVGATIDDDVSSCDHDHVLDNGEVGTLTVTMKNVGMKAVAAVARVSSSNPHVSFPNGASVTFPTSTPFSTATTQIKVALNGVTDFTSFDVKLDLDGPELVPAGPRSTTLTFFGNYDFAPQSSATDSFDAPDTLWSVAHDGRFLASDWLRVSSAPAFGQQWLGPDVSSPADETLVSPPLHVAAGARFGFALKHHFGFEANGANFFDGGVIELSQDGGVTWSDIGGSITDNKYGGVIINDPNDFTPLAGRSAFVGTSKGAPADLVSTVDLGTAFQGQTVQVRFRVGTDDGTGGPGWFINEVAFTGLSDTPFTARVPQRTVCGSP